MNRLFLFLCLFSPVTALADEECTAKQLNLGCQNAFELDENGYLTGPATCTDASGDRACPFDKDGVRK